eukprot:m.19893 g.19893  ORF g.19893 m.19893 type:complete len:80 (+) comp3480_c0_seq1:203-442(+)
MSTGVEPEFKKQREHRCSGKGSQNSLQLRAQSAHLACDRLQIGVPLGILESARQARACPLADLFDECPVLGGVRAGNGL